MAIMENITEVLLPNLHCSGSRL